MTSDEKIIYVGSSEFSDYRIADTIYEGRPARVLLGGGHSGQSGIALDDNPELLFDYNQRFLEIVESQKPKRVLIIGGGAFTLPKVLLERFVGMKVDVVEIDELLPELAQEYFGLVPNKNLTIYIQDGREFIETTKEKYDLIILDAFSGYDIPKKLITLEAAQNYKRILKKQGVMAINFIAVYRTHRTTLAHQLHATFSRVFTLVEIYPADRSYWTYGEQNLLLIISSAPRVNVDYLQSSAVELTHLPEDAELQD